MGFLKLFTGQEKPAAPQNPAETEVLDSGELIAVITAAIAAADSSAYGGGSGLIIRKINRVAGPVLAWNNAGINECIDSRRM